MSTHQSMSFNRYKAWRCVKAWCFRCFVLYKFKVLRNIFSKPIPNSQSASTRMYFPMNLATSCLMMPHFVANDVIDLGAQLVGHNSFQHKFISPYPITLQTFAHYWSLGLVKHEEMNNKVVALHQQQKRFLFFVFDWNCRASLETPYASTRFVNVILHMVMSTSQNSRTLQLTIHMEVKWVIFVGATMVFILQVQWWGAISNSFLIIYIYIYIYIPLTGHLMYHDGDALIANHLDQSLCIAC